MIRRDRENDRSLPSARGVAIQAYLYLWRERIDFFLLAAAPAVFTAFAETALKFLAGGSFFETDAENVVIGVVPLFYGYAAAAILLYVMFAVAWHQKRILRIPGATVAAALVWDRYKSKFLLRSLALGGAMALAALPPVVVLAMLASTPALMVFAVPVGLGAAALVFARGSLWQTAAALGDPLPFGALWRTGAGRNGWLLLVVVLTPVPLMALRMLIMSQIHRLSMLTGLNDGLTVGLLLSLFDHGLAYIGVAVGLTALSFAYTVLRPVSA